MNHHAACRGALLLGAMVMLAGCVTRSAPVFVAASLGAGSDPREVAFSWDLAGTTDRVRLEVGQGDRAGFSPVDLDANGKADAADEISARRGAIDLKLPLHFTDFEQTRYRLVALDAAGAALARSGALPLDAIAPEPLIGYFKSPDPVGAARFGARVALSADGTTLAVGAPGEPDANGPGARNAGAVYLFTGQSDGGWSQAQRLRGTNTRAGDMFGSSVAVSADGSTLVVGAPGEAGAATGIDGADNDLAFPWAGAAYVFVRERTGGWSQQAYVKASNTGARDTFGARLALSADGDTLAVGAWGEDGFAVGIDGPDHDFSGSADLFPQGAGAVYVFTREQGDRWLQQAYVKASNTAVDDWFGDSVALSAAGNTLAVGASKKDGGAGAVYVFRRGGGGKWAQRAYLEAPQRDPGDGFGVSLALTGSGDTLVVGAWGEDIEVAGTGARNAGAVHVFERAAGAAWVHHARLRAGNAGAGDAFGATLALASTGDALAVGAWGEDGAATGINGPDNDDAGNAGPHPISAGAVYVFQREPGAGWSQRAYVKASNTDGGDVFGDSVALSADGRVLAVGASNEDGSSGRQDDNGVHAAGAVYLY